MHVTGVQTCALAPIGLTATGIIGLIGEADGGAPGSAGILQAGGSGVAGVVQIDDPVLAKQYFKSGPLADAIRLAFDSSADPRIPGGAFRVQVFKTNQSVQASTTMPGTTAAVTADTIAAGTTTTVLNVTTGGLVVNAHQGRWLSVTGFGMRRIVSNTATAITVSPGFNAVPTNGTTATILASMMLVKSADYGAHTNGISIDFDAGVVNSQAYVVVIDMTNGKIEQSPEIGGSSFLNLMYAGGPITDSGVVVSCTSNTVVYTTAATPLVNAYVGTVLQLPDGTRRLISANSIPAGGQVTVTIDPTMPVLTTAQQTAYVGGTVQVRNITSATGSFSGSAGVATGLVIAVLPTADNLNISFATQNLTTLQQLVDYINANTNYIATVPVGVNANTTLLANFDFNARNTTVDVRFDNAVLPATKGTFRQDLVTIINWINTYSTQVTASRSGGVAAEGSGPPQTTSGSVGTPRSGLPIYLTGGSRGTSSNSQWQTAFDTLQQVRVNHIVPLVSQDGATDGYGSTYTFASIAAMLTAHVTACAGIIRNERGGYLGMNGTLATLLSQAANANNTDVQVFGQKQTVLNVDGTVVTQQEWASAIMAASMRAGTAEVGEPLTYKFIKSQGFTQDTSWSPKSITNVNSLIAGGVMFCEQVPGSGIRWVRDLTSYLIDDNIAYMDGNTREAVRFIAYDLRTSCENKFTGLKATPATVSNIRDFVAAKCALYLQNNIIVKSLDPETQTSIIPGFRRLRVTISGNVATIRIEIFPVTGIVFQLDDITLQLPVLAAGT
jgi:hypothetical protein